MYNRYLNEARPPDVEPPAAQASQEQERAEPVGGLLGGLTRRIGNFRIDADTLVVFAVIWFILSESGEELESELLIAIAVLLLLGI